MGVAYIPSLEVVLWRSSIDLTSGELMVVLSIGGSLVGRLWEVVLMSRYFGALSGNLLVDRLWVVSLVGDSLVS